MQELDDELQRKVGGQGPPPEWDIRYWDLQDIVVGHERALPSMQNAMTTTVDRAVLLMVEQYRMDRVAQLMDPNLVYFDEVVHPLIEMVRMDLAVDLIRRMPEAQADAARSIVLGVDPQARELVEQSRVTAELLSRVKGNYHTYVDSRALREVGEVFRQMALKQGDLREAAAAERRPLLPPLPPVLQGDPIPGYKVASAFVTGQLPLELFEWELAVLIPEPILSSQRIATVLEFTTDTAALVRQAVCIPMTRLVQCMVTGDLNGDASRRAWTMRWVVNWLCLRVPPGVVGF